MEKTKVEVAVSSEELKKLSLGDTQVIDTAFNLLDLDKPQILPERRPIGVSDKEKVCTFFFSA